MNRNTVINIFMKNNGNSSLVELIENVFAINFIPFIIEYIHLLQNVLQLSLKDN